MRGKVVKYEISQITNFSEDGQNWFFCEAFLLPWYHTILKAAIKLSNSVRRLKTKILGKVLVAAYMGHGFAILILFSILSSPEN